VPSIEIASGAEPGASDRGISESAAVELRAPEPWGGDRSIRPVRSGPLRDLLDAEFRRNHRFETLSSFFGDLRTLLRKAVVRDDETLGMERFLPNSSGREF